MMLFRYRYLLSVVFLCKLKPTDSSENIARNKTTSQTPGWLPSSIAVDGQNTQCNKHFTHTELKQQYAWWQVDLEDVYEIKRIEIYYRKGFEQRLNGYSIIISGTMNALNPYECYKDTNINVLPSVHEIHECPHIGRYVNMSVERLPSKTYDSYDNEGAIINLCEFEVYGCKRGRYGNGNCLLNCSVGCRDLRCDPDYGNCTCNDGWKGEKCNIRICPKGQYGASCQPCPENCLNNDCNSMTGACTNGCVSSFYGTHCRLDCPVRCKDKICDMHSGDCNGCHPGNHGNKCNLTCPNNCKDKICRKINGHCETCIHPFQGDTCIDCMPGYYGDTCSPCSLGCLNGNCSKVHGYCTQGCRITSLKGDRCNECINGMYGKSCEKECPSTCNNTTCNASDGSCLLGCKYKNMKGNKCDACTDGFYGEFCNINCSENCKTCNKMNGNCLLCVQGKASGGKCSSLLNESTGMQINNGLKLGPIIGGLVAAIFVILTVVVIFLFLKRRRRNAEKSKGYENQIIFTEPKTNENSRDNCKQEGKKSDKINIYNESVASVENTNEYCNSPDVYMNLTLTDVPISELSSIISKKAAEKEFESEYDKLPKGSKYPTTVGKHPDNKIKNRFLTTFPYNHSRVVLKPISTQQKSDYINANYIDGADIRRAYIATQGPKTSTLFDFWKMVWQEKSGKIIMLTNLIENEKPKCEQYWPDIGQEKDFGPLKVTLESEKEYAFFVERTFQLTNKKTKETRQILQFHYTMWPDHGTPDPVQLMLFHRKVKEVTTTLTGPPIIHCAAGIGRTGTFIALDALHDYGDKTGRIDIFEYVIRMRKDRMNMIQTLEQYVVLHEALLESFQYTGRSLSRNKFLEVCSELNKAKPKNQTHVYKEFQNLSALRPVYGIESYDSALEKDNRRKSRNQNILALEKYRPFLMSQHSSRNNFINAVMLPTFRKKCGYFVTHYPLENTVVDFWCMVFDHESSTVVVLDEISDKDNVLHWYPDNETEMTVDSFQIKKVSGPHINGRVREIEFSVTHHDDEKSVWILMIRPWPTERCVPPDKNDLVKLIEMTLERQATDSGPVTIVCSDGARCCGLFCTVCNVILNLRIEDEIDIFHTVRQLQIRRPQFITDYEEYKSCYEIVKLFLESSSASVYANA